MEISKTLRDAIDGKKVSSIRSVFYTIAHEDPGFFTGKFRETLNYVKSLNIDGLMQTYDGAEFKAREEWNEDYWGDIVSELLVNFCDERIDHLEDVGKVVFVNKKPIRQAEHQNNKIEREASNAGPKALPKGLIIGIGVAAVLIVGVVILIVNINK